MQIEPKTVTIGDLVDGFSEDPETDRVVGYAGQLNIRPAYQREYIYEEKEREALIDSVLRGYPIGVLYWADNEVHTDEVPRYEIVDGQQRVLTLVRYVNSQFSIPVDGTPKYFHNLPESSQCEFQEHQLSVYVCKGEREDRLKWFERINVGSKPLSAQEVRNAVYVGAWVVDAKRYFNKNSAAASMSSDYVKAAAERQELLEVAIGWACGSTSDERIRKHMAAHRQDSDATSLWQHFKAVIEWIEDTFKPRPLLQSVGRKWGELYSNHKDDPRNRDELEEKIAHLLTLPAISRREGVYEYVLSGEKDETVLHVRNFRKQDKERKYEEQQKRCAETGEELPLREMHADHIIPWSEGGETSYENLRMVSRKVNLHKGAR